MIRMRRDKPKQGVYLLLGELMRSDRLPPATLGFIALNVVIYLELFDINYPSIDAVCLSANGIINNRQWLRLVLSALYHGDDWHLYYNMISFSIKGRSLERRYGSAYFLILVALFTVYCSFTYVGIEYLAYLVFQSETHLYTCAVGFSAVIFALKVLTTHYLPSGTVYILDTIPVPSKYAYWAELVIISLVSHNVSFAGKIYLIILS